MSGALYTLEDGVFEPTDLTVSPWSPHHCHGGPPSALLTRAIELLEPDGFHMTRITVEILAQIPLVPVVVTAGIVRPGKRVQLASAELATVDGAVLAKATGWRSRHREPMPLPAVAAHPPLEFPSHESLPADSMLGPGHRHFYRDAQERRVIAGAFDTPGPAAMWFRLSAQVVEGEEPSAVQRVVSMADSANGISSVAGMDELLFINTDLTVHLLREPHGEWFAMEAASYLDPAGRGMSDAALYDTDGLVGRANQALFVDER